MAASTKRAQESAKRVGDAASSLRSNPYVTRLIEDEELRANIREAFESARNAYARIANGKGPQALIDDKKVQRELRKAVLDRLFGAEEEFEYTSTTSPAPETATTQSS